MAREPAAAPAPEPTPVSELPGEELPKVFRAKAETSKKVREAATTGVVWAGMAAAMTAVLAVALVFRVDAVKLWPSAAGAYASVGLKVNSLGLDFEGVRWEPALQDGHAAIAVSGMVRNIKDEAVVSPPLRVTLLDKKGKVLALKIAKPADPRIPPGKTRHFAIALIDPPSSAVAVDVSFEPEDHKPHRKPQHPVAHAAPPGPLRGAAEPTPPPAPAPVEAHPLPAGSPYAISPSHD